MVFVYLKGVVTKLAGGLLTLFVVGEAVITGETAVLVLLVLFVLLPKFLIRRVALVWRMFPGGF